MNTDQTAPAEPQDLHQLEAQRRLNRDATAALGLSPYGQRVDGLTPLAEARAQYSEAADQDHQANNTQPGYTDRRPVVTVAGRVVLRRDTGKLIWMNLRDHTGDLQVAVSKRDCGPEGFAAAKLRTWATSWSRGVRSCKTKTGEVTCLGQRAARARASASCRRPKSTPA
jgi:lysyl-tRNA synthetase class 2